MKQTNIATAIEFTDNFILVRIAIAAVAGVFIAGLLTLFMHVLIEFSQQELVETSRANFLDFVRVKRQESSQRKKAKPQRPKTQEAPPAPPAPQSDQQNMSDSGLQVSIPTASADINVDMGGAIGTGDGEYLPIVKVAPGYPVKAAASGKEGTCLVEFTVTSTGATRDVIVIHEECPKVFARASVTAARKFKYKPRIIDGEAIEVPNVRNRFVYILDKPETQQ